MICVYPADCTDFSTNGNGTLAPLSAEVTETLNGEYELTLVHPIDEAGKWQRLVEGCILRAPVPAAMTPRVNFTAPGDDNRTEVWRINTDFSGAQTRKGTLRLRSGPGTRYKTLASYKNGSLVQVIAKTNPFHDSRIKVVQNPTAAAWVSILKILVGFFCLGVQRLVLFGAQDFIHEALRFLMINNTCRRLDGYMLADESGLSRQAISSYLKDGGELPSFFDLASLCIGMNLPSWISEPLLKMIGTDLPREGVYSVWGQLLDCYCLLSAKDAKEYINNHAPRPKDNGADDGARIVIFLRQMKGGMIKRNSR